MVNGGVQDLLLKRFIIHLALSVKCLTAKLSHKIKTIRTMNIYKFTDSVDGNTAFVIAKNLTEAIKALRETTSIDFHLVKRKTLEELDKSIVIINKIMPF